MVGGVTGMCVAISVKILICMRFRWTVRMEVLGVVHELVFGGWVDSELRIAGEVAIGIWGNNQEQVWVLSDNMPYVQGKSC